MGCCPSKQPVNVNALDDKGLQPETDTSNAWQLERISGNSKPGTGTDLAPNPTSPTVNTADNGVNTLKTGTMSNLTELLNPKTIDQRKPDADLPDEEPTGKASPKISESPRTPAISETPLPTKGSKVKQVSPKKSKVATDSVQYTEVPKEYGSKKKQKSSKKTSASLKGKKHKAERTETQHTSKTIEKESTATSGGTGSTSGVFSLGVRGEELNRTADPGGDSEYKISDRVRLKPTGKVVKTNSDRQARLQRRSFQRDESAAKADYRRRDAVHETIHRLGGHLLDKRGNKVYVEPNTPYECKDVPTAIPTTEDDSQGD